MEKKIRIDAVQFVREIRDQHATHLHGKSNREIIEFFRKEAEKMSENLLASVLRKKEEAFKQ